MCYIDTVKELISLTNAHNLVEIEIHHDMTRIRIKKNGLGQQICNQGLESGVVSLESGVVSQDSGLRTQDSRLKTYWDGEITSPMVGTFYRALSPGATPYIDVGSEVTPETVTGVIETMKIINELNAGVTGRVVEVLVEDGEAVEYGQPLFRVIPLRSEHR